MQTLRAISSLRNIVVKRDEALPFPFARVIPGVCIRINFMSRNKNVGSKNVKFHGRVVVCSIDSVDGPSGESVRLRVAVPRRHLSQAYRRLLNRYFPDSTDDVVDNFTRVVGACDYYFFVPETEEDMGEIYIRRIDREWFVEVIALQAIEAFARGPIVLRGGKYTWSDPAADDALVLHIEVDKIF